MPPFRRLESSKLSHPASPGDAPPDLTQSVEEAYRSFLSPSITDAHKSRRESYSTALLTPDSEINPFILSGDNETAVSIGEVIPSGAEGPVKLGPYGANAARRFAELGYMQPPMPPNELQRRRAVRK